MVKKDLGNRLTGQKELFATDLSEGSLDVSLAFRGALSKAFSRCKQSRYQIAGLLSEATRRNISKDSLDKFCSSNLDYALRAEDLPAVIAVTQDIGFTQVLLNPVGCEILLPEDSKFVKLARLTQKKKEILSEIARLEAQLGMTAER